MERFEVTTTPEVLFTTVPDPGPRRGDDGDVGHSEPRSAISCGCHDDPIGHKRRESYGEIFHNPFAREWRAIFMIFCTSKGTEHWPGKCFRKIGITD